MNLGNIKLPITIIGVIVAQAFGIIWYVAQLDSTVKNLDISVAEIKQEQSDIDIAVLQTEVDSLKDEMDNNKFAPGTNQRHRRESTCNRNRYCLDFE